MLSTLYAAIARRRREWYAARPEARRRLRHPVISIGNIAAGGRGKTQEAPAETAAPAGEDGRSELADLKAQLAELQKKLDRLSD